MVINEVSDLKDVGHVERHDEFFWRLVQSHSEEPGEQLQAPSQPHRHEQLAVGAEPGKGV